jgi:hypothetical protein
MAQRALRCDLGQVAARTGERLRNHEGQPLTAADVRQNFKVTLRPVFASKRLPPVPDDRFRGYLERGERLFEQPFAQRRGFLLLQRLEEMPDARSRLAGGHETQPRRIRPCRRRGHDLDLVAAFQFRAQRHELVIDPRCGAMVADVGVHGVGEVDGGSAARQRHDLALGREDVDLVREEVAFDVLEEFLRIA